MRYWLCIITLVFTLKSYIVIAQTDSTSNDVDSTKKSSLLIADIKIVGNKRTKPYVILREMTLKKGDIITAQELTKQIEISKNQIFNTALFLETNITKESKTGDIITITIEVKERWYLFPLPYMVLVDRNFNQWWVTENHDLSRVNYGIKFTQFNLTGNNDGMEVWFINGYNKQINCRYNLPFFDKGLKSGINVGYTYSSQKELNDSTSFNKQVFVKGNDFVRTINRADITYSYRPDQKWRHYVSAYFTKESIADTIFKSNSFYYPDNRKELQYVELSYSFRYLNLDYNSFPTKGYSFNGYLYKRGLDKTTNLWQVGLGAFYARPLWNKAFLWLSGAATAKTPNNINYINQRLFGYGDFVLRGLEYYVVDGDAGAVAKITLHQKIFNYTLNTHLKSKNYSKIPFGYYLKLYGDAGYAHNSFAGNSLLNNKLMYTAGIGLDVVSIYDFIFRFELSFNQLGTHGLYLHAH